ncbi:MAG: T9SS type A sorting domain-containing protein, partial [Bacteroidia bacterium]
FGRPAGTVGGDNPSTVAAGTITITGVTENTNITVTITGGTCNISRNVTSPACKPVNTLPYVESFDYAVGSALGAQQRWTNLNSGDEVTAVSGSLTYTGVPTAGNSVLFSGAGIDPHTPFTTVSEGTLFASMLFNVTDMTNVTAEGASTYFASLTEETRTNFRARLFVRKAETQYQIGFDNASTTTNYDPTLRNVGDVVLVIMGYDFATNLLKCWINPNLSTFNASTPATLTSTPAEGPATTIANLGGFILRQDGGTNTPTIQFDELRISTTLEQLLSVRSNEIAGLQVYPNPVSNGVLYINTNLNSSKSVQIFDLLGKQVLTTSTDTNSVNVSTLTRGMYIVKITEEGKTATRKIVVE